MNWTKLVCAALIVSGAAWAQGEAQNWNIGLFGAYGWSPDLTIQGKTSSVSAGLGHGYALGFYGGEDTYKYWGGEARYLYRFGDLQASSGGVKVGFEGAIHILTFDIMPYLRPRGARVRPFFEFGGGIQVVEGTGNESASQPLGNLVALTHTRETVPVGDAAFGVKLAVSKHVHMRVEVHDYVGPAAKDVIAPAPGTTERGVSNNLMGSVSVGYNW